MEQWHFYRHMPVYGQNGRVIGRAEEVGHAGSVIHVQRGHFLIEDWYVPFHAIDDVTEWGVVLSVNLNDLRGNGWNVPPEEFLSLQGATPGYEYRNAANWNADKPHTHEEAKPGREV